MRFSRDGARRARRMADGRFEAVAVAPGGRRAAALDARGRLVVVDANGLRRGPRCDAPVWAGAYTPVARRDCDTYDDELDVLRHLQLDPLAPELLAAREGHRAAVADGRLMTAGARTGDPRTRAKLPAGQPWRLLALDPAPAQGARARSGPPAAASGGLGSSAPAVLKLGRNRTI